MFRSDEAHQPTTIRTKPDDAEYEPVALYVAR